MTERAWNLTAPLAEEASQEAADLILLEAD